MLSLMPTGAPKMFQLTIVPAILVAAVLATAIPQPGNEGKETLIDQVLKHNFCNLKILIFTFSYCQNFGGKEHFPNNKDLHNVENDHDAFLGPDEAKNFEQLTPEESQKRLG
jgi:hypothetical protein